MAVKKLLKESELLDEVGTDEISTVPTFIERMTMISKSEEDAIAEYDVLLGTVGLPEELRDTIREIQNDEKDHLVLISNAIQRYTNSEFSENTEELDELPYPENDKEIIDVPMEDDSDIEDIPEESDEELDIDIPDDSEDIEF